MSGRASPYGWLITPVHRNDQPVWFLPWLKKIVINEALDVIRQRSRFSSLELEAVEEPAVSNSVIEKTDAAAILQLVRKLPPATHAVFVLYAIDGYTHREIATQLNISEGTSKWHLSAQQRQLPPCGGIPASNRLRPKKQRR